LILTLWPPTAKYKILRRYADLFPAGRLAWASLQPCDGAVSFAHKAALPRQLHWRLRRTAAGWLYLHQFQARRLAAEIVQWARPFNPRVLWVLPELGAAHVAPYVAQALKIPLHVTSHDAHETARHIVPPLYYPFYARAVRRVFRRAHSVDAISEGLLEHLQRDFPNLRSSNSMVFHPSIDPRLIRRPGPVRDRPWESGTRRVIGLCGSMRISRQQWEEFLQALSALPYRVELVSLAYKDRFFGSTLPANVTVTALPFAETEADIISVFHERQVDACYLGLWRDPSQAFFGRTSLSAKLVTYAAASLPILVDADEDSMAWRLVARHGAGVRLDGGAGGKDALAGLFGDCARWNAAALGAGRLCEAEFNQETNFDRFAGLLDKVAAEL
jgi:hypothetical protein